jgi:6-phosphogluconolactonase
MSRTAAILAALVLAAIVQPAGSASALVVRGAVFTMTNSAVAENQVVAFERRADGSLRLVGTFNTGGLGSGPAPTSTAFGAKIPLPADGLGSQNSLLLSPDRRLLFAVNAGSNSIACFRVDANGSGALLSRARTAASGGVFPVSLTFRGNASAGGVLYVLNAGGAGDITGFAVDADCGLTRLAGGQKKRLDLLVGYRPVADPAPNEVRTTPAQIGFTPDGRRLVVAFKGGPAAEPGGSALTGAVAVLSVTSAGALTGQASVTSFGASTRAEPTSFLFGPAGHLLVTHMRGGSLGSYAVDGPTGRLVAVDRVAGAFNCWVARLGNLVYAMSFGDIPARSGGLPDGPGTIRGLRVAPNGELRLLPDTGSGAGVVAILPQDDASDWTPGSHGAFGNHGVDIAAVSDGGRAFLYAAEPRLGQIGAWEIGGDGALRAIGKFGRSLPDGVDPFAGTNPGIGNFLERCFLQDSPRSPECAAGSLQGLAGF